MHMYMHSILKPPQKCPEMLYVVRMLSVDPSSTVDVYHAIPL